MTHLKYKGLQQQHKITSRDLRVRFVSPTSFEAYEQKQIIASKVEIYKAVTEQEEFSKTLAMGKYLKMTDEEIEENFKNLEEEKLRLALIEYKIKKVEADGTIKSKDDYQKVTDLITKRADQARREREEAEEKEEKEEEPEEPEETPEEETPEEEPEEAPEETPPEEEPYTPPTK